MIVWCMLVVQMECLNGPGICSHETGVEGVVLETTADSFIVDFSKYAKKHGYFIKNKQHKKVPKHVCIYGANL